MCWNVRGKEMLPLKSDRFSTSLERMIQAVIETTEMGVRDRKYSEKVWKENDSKRRCWL